MTKKELIKENEILRTKLVLNQRIIEFQRKKIDEANKCLNKGINKLTPITKKDIDNI